MRVGEPALAYHRATKHSYESVRAAVRSLAWDRKPDPFKRYPSVSARSLPREAAFPRVAAGDALRSSVPPGDQRLSASDLGWLLWLGAGAHRPRSLGGEEVRFRTYASAGALYPNEVYAAVGDVEGLPAGLHHFEPAEPALHLLRDGDPRPHLVRAAAGLTEVAEAPVTLILTGIPWRTGWKYGERGYRHLFWDAGMIVANLLAASSALGVTARVVTGFVDGEAETLLGLDPLHEVPLCLVALGAGASVGPAGAPPDPPDLAATPLGAHERFPLAEAVHEAGRLHDTAEVQAWRERAVPRGGPPQPRALRLPPIREARDPMDRVILRRGSARVFHPSVMPLPVLTAILEAAAARVPSDAAPRVEPFLMTHAVEDLPAGSYRFGGSGLQPLREGDFRRKAAFLCLEQPLGGQGSATLFLLTDLDAVLSAWGDRGYRVAQLAGGLAAGRAYLAAYALGWGATGLTFYDDEVIRFFEPAAAGMETLLAVGLGESIGRPDLRPAR